MDINELIKGTVAAITVQLSSLSDDDLAALLTAETAAASPRTSLVAAIRTEQAARGGDQTAREENDALIAANSQIDTLTTQVAELNDKLSSLYTDNHSLTEQLTATHDENDQLKAQIIAMEGKLADGATMELQSGSGTVLLVVGTDLSGLTKVVFGDHNNEVLSQIPALQFDASCFKDGGNGSLILDRAISFPRGAPANAVWSVWLVGEEAEGKLTGGVCRLLMPFSTGGGRAAELPAGHLRFSTTS